MQPVATTVAPVSAAASSVSIESCLAFSTNPEVLPSTPSASEPSVVTCQPSAASRAASSSESTSLRAQPRVSRATRRLAGLDTPRGTGPVRHRRPRPTRVSIPAAAQPVEHLVQLVRLDQHLARLRPLTRPDDAARLHQVHQPPGLGEPDPQLALQHRGRAELRADHQLGGLDEQLQVVADVLVDLLAGFLRRRPDIRPELRLPLGLAEPYANLDIRPADPA